MPRRSITWLALLVLSVFISACAKQSGAPLLAPVSALPDMVKSAPASVRTAYQFALARVDALQNAPCYCGYGSIGHQSNLACYVKDMNHDGKVVFDRHARSRAGPCRPPRVAF